MLERGCRSFVFLGRSGLDKKAAADLVQDVRAAGANVVVVRGDVRKLEDVKKCVSVAGTPVGGVIHAAMGLKVCSSIHAETQNHNREKLTCFRRHYGHQCRPKPGTPASNQKSLVLGTCITHCKARTRTWSSSL